MNEDKIDFIKDFGDITWVFINKYNSNKCITESGKTREDAIVKIKSRDLTFSEDEWEISSLRNKFESLHLNNIK